MIVRLVKRMIGNVRFIAIELEINWFFMVNNEELSHVVTYQNLPSFAALLFNWKDLPVLNITYNWMNNRGEISPLFAHHVLLIHVQRMDFYRKFKCVSRNKI